MDGGDGAGEEEGAEAALMDILECGGIDMADAMERFDGNRALYGRLAVRFLDDPHFDALEAAMASGDAEEAYRHAHTLKGTAGNLSFRDLYAAASRLAEALRAGDVAAARALMPPVRESHATVTATLHQLKR